MDTSKLLIKSLFLTIANAMIVMTLILSPIPFSRVGDAYAADSAAVEPSCADREKDPGQVYKAGCKFNENLNKTDIKDPYRDGIPGIFEQMIGGLFAMIGVELLVSGMTPMPSSLIDCPSHIGPNISIPMVAAGSLAYLIGEVRGNLAFQEASKMAVEKNFQARKDESYLRTGTKEDRGKSRAEAKENEQSNDKQVASFNALEEIYKKQVEGVNNKKNLVRFAQTAFIGAEVVEAGDILYHAGAYGNSYKTIESLDKVNQTSFYSLILALSLGQANTVVPLPTCNGIASAGAVYATKTILKDDIAKISIGKDMAGEALLSTVADMVLLLFNLNPVTLMMNIFTSVVLNLGNHLKDVNRHEMYYLKNASLTATTIGVRSKLSNDIATAVPECGLELSLAISEKEAEIAAAIAATATAAAIAALKAQLAVLVDSQVANNSLVASMGAIITGRSMPLFCGGAFTNTPPTLDTPNVPFLSNLVNQLDRLILTADVPLVQSSPNELFYFEKILQNAFYKIAINKVHTKKYESAEKRISQIAANTQYADIAVREIMKDIKNLDIEKEMMNLQNKYQINEKNLQKKLSLLLMDLRFDILKSTQANPWMDLLKFGVKIYLALKFLSVTFKNFGFSKPALRMFTYGLMATLNGSVNDHLEKVEEESKKRAEIVAKERELFIESNPLRGEDLTGVTAYGGKLNIKTAKLTKNDSSLKGKLACGVANGKSIAPAVCPSKLLPSLLNTPVGEAKFLPSGGLLSNTAGLVSSLGTSIGRGESLAPGTTAGANLAILNGSRNQLIKKRDELRKKIDKLNNKLSDSLKKDGKEAPKLTSIAAASAKFKKLYDDSASSTGEAFSSLKSGKIPDLEKLKTLQKDNGAKSAGFSVPKFSIPTPASNGFDFDTGSGDGVVVEDKVRPSDVKEQNLDQFVVNTEEINENENVDIFKLISNRYLVSYPRLLEEK